MKIADIFEKIKPALKKYWWYIILLIMSSVYVFVNWNNIISIRVNVDGKIFWLGSGYDIPNVAVIGFAILTIFAIYVCNINVRNDD